MNTFKKILIMGTLAGLLVAVPASAQIGGGIGPTQYWKLSGTVLQPISSAWSVLLGALKLNSFTNMASTTPQAKGDIIVASSTTKWTNFAACANGKVLTGSSTSIFGWSCETPSAVAGGSGISSTTPFSAGYVPIAISSNSVTNSVIFQSGINIGIGTTTPSVPLSVVGSSTFSGNISANIGYFNQIYDANATSTQCETVDPITGLLKAGSCVVSLNNLTGNVLAMGNAEISISSSTGNLVFSHTTLGSTYIGVSTSNASTTITNNGVQTLTAGTGIGVSSATGTPTITNQGVQSLIAGSGISLDKATGTVTISATGGSSGSNLTIGIKAGMAIATGTPVYIATSTISGINQGNTTTTVVSNSTKNDQDTINNGTIIGKAQTLIHPSGTSAIVGGFALQPSRFAGSPGNIVMSFASGTITTAPTSSAIIYTCTIPASQIPSHPTYLFIACKLPQQLTLDVGSVYTMYASSTSGDGSNYYVIAEQTAGFGTNTEEWSDTGGAWTKRGANTDSSYELYTYNQLPFTTQQQGLVYTATASNPSSSLSYIGFTQNNVASGSIVSVITNGLVEGLSGLSAGNSYFLGNTSGTLSVAPGTVSTKVGIAASSSAIILKSNF